MKHEEYLKKIRVGKSGAGNFGMGIRFEFASLAEMNQPEKTMQALHYWIKNPVRFLLLMGGPGTGKTFAAASILNWFWEKGEDIYYISTRNFFRKIQDAIQTDGNQYFVVEWLSEFKFLIIDDMGSSTNTEWQQEMLLELIDRRYNSKLPTIITTNFYMDEIKNKLGYRIHSRLNCNTNLKLSFGYIDRRETEKIIEMKAP